MTEKHIFSDNYKQLTNVYHVVYVNSLVIRINRTFMRTINTSVLLGVS